MEKVISESSVTSPAGEGLIDNTNWIWFELKNCLFSPSNSILLVTPSGLPNAAASLLSRQNYKKSHNCVSLFAKCNCKDGQRKKVLQTYVHPDTAFVFTDENKNAAVPRERKYTMKDRSAQLPRTKRLSTPNFGNYTILDVAGKCFIELYYGDKRWYNQCNARTHSVVHPEVVLAVSHTNGMIEPMYAENTMQSRPRPILKKSFSAIRHESLNHSLDCLDQLKSKSNGNSRDGNLNNSSYDTKVAIRNAFFRNELERKFSNLSSDDFSSTQTDNLEYLKYNALSYQQNNVINDYEKEIYRQISDSSSSPRYYGDVSRSNSCEDKVEVSTKMFFFIRFMNKHFRNGWMN